MFDRFVDYSLERKENQAQLANLSLQTLAITSEIPLIEILRFRDRHRDELVKYRQLIHKLARQISGEFDTAQKQVYFEEMIRDEIIPEKEEIEEKLISERTFFVVANTVITITTVGAVILSGGQPWLVGILQGVGSLGLNYYGNIRKERSIKDKPVGYLYHAQKEFGANS